MILARLIIFEHIRCDRLLHAGFKILSEESYERDDSYKKSFSNLKIIPYSKVFVLAPEIN